MAVPIRILLGITALATALLAAARGTEERPNGSSGDDAYTVLRVLWAQIPSAEPCRDKGPSSRGLVDTHAAFWSRNRYRVHRAPPEPVPDEANTVIVVRHVRRILRMDSDEP